MEISWYGLSCFRLTERGLATVVTDPYDSQVVGYEPLKLKADIVTVSHAASGHNHTAAVKGFSHLISGPGNTKLGGFLLPVSRRMDLESGTLKNRAIHCMSLNMKVSQ